jgi:serine palmitoyltransferase
VFSAALPAILAVTASESISLLSSKEGEEQLALLTDNANTLRSILDKSEFVETSSDYNSPVSHYRLNDMALSACGLTTLQDQERLLQDVVDEVCLRWEQMLTTGE